MPLNLTDFISLTQLTHTHTQVLISIQSLLTDPYCEVCMEPEIGYLYKENRKAFDAVARSWTWRFAMLDVLTPGKLAQLQ